MIHVKPARGKRNSRLLLIDTETTCQTQACAKSGKWRPQGPGQSLPTHVTLRPTQFVPARTFEQPAVQLQWPSSALPTLPVQPATQPVRSDPSRPLYGLYLRRWMEKKLLISVTKKSVCGTAVECRYVILLKKVKVGRYRELV